MYYDSNPEILRLVIAERHDELRREAYVGRLRRIVRAERRQLRRERREERAARLRHRPQLAAPPPIPAE